MVRKVYIGRWSRRYRQVVRKGQADCLAGIGRLSGRYRQVVRKV
jgi:hypothetical protein